MKALPVDDESARNLRSTPDPNHEPASSFVEDQVGGLLPESFHLTPCGSSHMKRMLTGRSWMGAFCAALALCASANSSPWFFPGNAAKAGAERVTLLPAVETESETSGIFEEDVVYDGALEPASFNGIPLCPHGLPVHGSGSRSGAATFPQIALTGFFQADAGWFAQDAANQAAVGDIPDIIDFRRARLAAKGKVAENVGYMIEFDFAFPGRPTFMDVYMDVLDTPVGNFRVGQWRTPFGMDALTSARELPFLERALPFAFLPFRQTGVGLSDTMLNEGGTWAVAGYRFPVDPFGSASGDKGYGAATRVTLAPWYDEGARQVVHVGADYSINNPSTSTIRYRSTPEIGFTQGDFNGNAATVPFFVDTGALAANNINLFAAEAAAAWGPVLAQSEFFYVIVDQPGAPALGFSGAYSQMSWVLTGEHHPYNLQQGVFNRVTPNNNFGPSGWGAWELAARWSYIDLNSQGVAGGRLNDVTIGLNWYLNRLAKFQLNYIRAMLNDPTDGYGAADIAAMRVQVDF